jgi:hypothetical protein
VPAFTAVEKRPTAPDSFLIGWIHWRLNLKNTADGALHITHKKGSGGFSFAVANQ